MKIAIIGKGTSAIVTALQMISYGEHEVEFFYDPKTPHLSVGESSTPHIVKNLKEVCGITIEDLESQGIVSKKQGVNFIGWGKTPNWIHPFRDNETAVHFQTDLFNKFVHDYLENEMGIKYHPFRVEDSDYKFEGSQVTIHGNTYDFVVECSGWYYDYEYLQSDVYSVDSAVLHVSENIEREDYTIHRATPDGWQFELPFKGLGVSKCGYLYNSKMMTEERLWYLKKSFNSDRVVSWKPRYSRKLLRDPRVGMNGNKLFFFEPLQALSLLYYHVNAEITCDFLKNRNKLSFADQNYRYRKTMGSYFKTLALHYRFGSIYDTPYWNYITDTAEKYSKFSSVNTGDLDTFIHNIKMDRYMGENFEEDNSYCNVGVMGLEDNLHIVKNMMSLSDSDLTFREEDFSDFR